MMVSTMVRQELNLDCVRGMFQSGFIDRAVQDAGELLIQEVASLRSETEQLRNERNELRTLVPGTSWARHSGRKAWN